MKKFFLISIGIFLFFNSGAQPNYFSVANQKNFSSNTHKIIKATPNNYFTVGSYGGTLVKYFTQLTCINDSGKVVFDINPLMNPLYEHVDLTDVIKTSDNKFVFVGHSNSCDAGLSEIFAGKSDSSGNMIWSKTYNDYTNFYDNSLIVELSNNNFAFCYSNKILFINNLGDTIYSTILSNDSIRSLAITPDNYLLIAYNNSIEKRDLSGAIHLSRNFLGGTTNIIVKSANEYIFNSGVVLYRTDSLFTTLDSMNLQASLTTITDIEPDSSGYQLLGNQKVIRVDSLFNAGSATLNIDPSLKFNSLLVDEDRVILAGEERTGTGIGSVESHSIVKSYDLNYQTGAETRDAGVININSSYMNWYQNGPLGPYIIFNLYATVKNFGQDTLHSVAANFYMHSTVANCNILEASGFANGINLAPQDSVIIYMGSFWNPHIVIANTVNFCVWSSAPDQHIDMDHSNDLFCKYFILPYVGIEENNPLPEIQLSPNPSIENLQINIPKLNAPINISLTDISGKEIINKIIDQANTSLSLEELNPGMYFLKINFANQQVVKKIIKQ